MIQTMYTAGLRRSELLQLKPRHINSKEDFIVVRQGKGRKDRRTILSKKTLKLLRKYYISYRPKTYLFEPAARPPWAGIAHNAILAIIIEMLITPAETGIAPNANSSKRPCGWISLRAICLP